MAPVTRSNKRETERNVAEALPVKKAKAGKATKASRATEKQLKEPTVPVVAKLDEKSTSLTNRSRKTDNKIAILHTLSFSLDSAQSHLESLDPRWRTLFSTVACKPYTKQKEVFNPFMALVCSIIGQQVSWLAARSIQHKFTRLFFPELPEKLPPHRSNEEDEADGEEKKSEKEVPFPTPAQILDLPDATPTLRSAGLSQRKTEYILELAQRFDDGRIVASELIEMDDASIRELLVQVRGIGVWTVDMFLMFSLKRPDILAVGDLGLQKGLCKWYTQQYPLANGGNDKSISIPPTSNNITHTTLLARLAKKQNKVYLTPQEMDELTEPWKPYRTVGCYYMWSLLDNTEKKK